MESEIDTLDLAEYFVDTFRNGGPFYDPMKEVLTDYISDRRSRDPEFKSSELFDAQEGVDYDWEELKHDFRIYLEKRLDRNHDGGLENPENEDDLEPETAYHLGYVEVGVPTERNEAFMTSTIIFQEPENPGQATYAEYLDESEGLDAIRHLLERGEREKVRNIIEKGINGLKKEKGLKAYEAVASTDPILAKDLLERTENSEVETQMRVALFNNNDIFEEFGDSLDF